MCKGCMAHTWTTPVARQEASCCLERCAAAARHPGNLHTRQKDFAMHAAKSKETSRTDKTSLHSSSSLSTASRSTANEAATPDLGLCLAALRQTTGNLISNHQCEQRTNHLGIQAAGSLTYHTAVGIVCHKHKLRGTKQLAVACSTMQGVRISTTRTACT
jgi:hypothetical protein